MRTAGSALTVVIRQLADQQEQIARDLHEACADAHTAGASWADIGQAVGISRQTVFRQFYGGDVIVASRPRHARRRP